MTNHLDSPAFAPSAIVDPAEYRRVLGHYATGVTVVAAIDAGEPVGMAVNSFTSVSLDPPLVAFFPAASSSTWPRIGSAGAFSVNVLSEGQHLLCRRFAGKDADRFAGVAWSSGPATGSPLLQGALGWIDCRIEDVRPAGDHLAVFGRVLALGATPGRPLLFHGGQYLAMGECLDPPPRGRGVVL